MLGLLLSQSLTAVLISGHFNRRIHCPQGRCNSKSTSDMTQNRVAYFYAIMNVSACQSVHPSSHGGFARVTERGQCRLS